MFSPELIALAKKLLAGCEARGLRLATAESCTGGLIAALITSIPGASAFFDCGLVTYANDAKTQMLGIHPVMIERHGAVSEEVARAMAAGMLRYAGLALSVTGIAGPTGGTEEKPVGLVHLGAATKEGVWHARHVFSGDRDAVRLQSVEASLRLGLKHFEA